MLKSHEMPLPRKFHQLLVKISKLSTLKATSWGPFEILNIKLYDPFQGLFADCLIKVILCVAVAQTPCKNYFREFVSDFSIQVYCSILTGLFCTMALKVTSRKLFQTLVYRYVGQL